jgi:uncharacterized protein with NAD-binding domain and iron-sulfur cluster
MAKRKVAVLGGGMAGLSAAYHLTRTSGLRQLHDVTVYQLGWRLGGKAASGRDRMGRNLEHGLHVWFGCYDNTFRLLQEVYESRRLPPDCPLQSWKDAVKSQSYTPVGVLDDRARWTYWPLTWPTNDGTPGDGALMPTFMEMLQILLGWVKEILTLAPSQPSPAATVAAAGAPPARAPFAGPSEPTIQHAIDVAHRHALSFGRDHNSQGRDGLEYLVELIGWTKTAFKRTAGEAAVSGTYDQMARDILDIFHALLGGIVWDLLLPDRPFESLDDYDLRAWLIRHGADPKIVGESTVVRVVYDTLFQYADGDIARPSYAAGTALGVIMRLIATYKGAMMWDIQSGMGEALIAPLYEALLANGVAFKFFRKVTRLHLTDDGQRIQRVHLDRQADMTNGEYAPTIVVNHVTCWPSEPLWKQLQGGAAMAAAKVDFESHWCAQPPAGREVLQLGTDFDTVVLAISLGAYKQLNDDPGICDELIARGGAFADYVANVGIVPTQAVQLWSDRSAEGLGWVSGKAATVSGPEYLNIWADMSQVLDFEPWQNVVKPKSLHYLTGTYPTSLYRQPSANVDVPKQAAAEVKQAAIDWLNRFSYGLWPAVDDGQTFQWSVLTDPGGAGGQARFDAQFWRANIDPTECCTLSAAGTTKFRLLPDQSGFENLVLAGEGTRHGFNTTAIEGAVMSGAAAARAICGQPAAIVGYDFLRRRPSEALA